ncbi:MAG: hypothetical protein GXY52_09190 [Chloroflexi bacterium]|nr:hypothetical protein [Chloroflexota bacterium]
MSRSTQLRSCLVTTILMLMLLGVPGAASHAEAPNQATLIILFDSGAPLVRCVEFNEAQLTGEQLLVRSGIQMVSQQTPGLGMTVCKIEHVGCVYPEEVCFCQCQGADCLYWSYWVWSGSDWTYASRGAAQQVVLPGSVNAWVWGDGKTKPSAPASLGGCAMPDSKQEAAAITAPTTIPQETYPYPDPGSSTSEVPPPPPADAEPTYDPYPAQTEAAGGQPTDAKAATNTPSVADTDSEMGTRTPRGLLTPLPSNARTATAAAQATPSATVPVTQATDGPDHSATAIAESATNAALTGTPAVDTAAEERRSLWAFVGLALLLLTAIGYVLVLRRRRERQGRID